MDSVSSFLDLAFVGFVALFPPVNPVGTAFVVDPFMHHLTRTERKLAAGKIAIYCFLICTITLFVGSWLFKLFGISLPVVQMAGGILICRTGWELLSSNSGPKTPPKNPARAAPTKLKTFFFIRWRFR